MPVKPLHHKAGTWIWRKPRTYCPKCGQRVDQNHTVNQIPQCGRCDAN